MLGLSILIIALVVLSFYFLFKETTAGEARAFRQQASPDTPFDAKRYRIWIEGTKDGAKGRYYLVAYGLTKESADRLNAQVLNTVQGANTIVPRLAPQGTVLYAFRRDGDEVIPVKERPEHYLHPLGTEPNSGADDIFVLETTGTILTLKTSETFGSMPISPCYGNNCIQGVLTFGENVGATSYQLTQVADGFTIGRNGTMPEYLGVGRQLCPPEPLQTNAGQDRIEAYNFMVRKCAVFRPGERGGPYIAMMGETDKPLAFHLEPV